MNRAIRTCVFSTLFPSSARPTHGVFVETRLRHLLATREVQATVVAPVPWFPSRHPRYGEWARLAATPRREERDGLEIWHPRYALPPKVGMSAAPLLLALGARRTVARLIRDGFDFDLFDAHYYYPDGAAAALLSRWFGKPFVVTARGTDLNLIPRYAIPRRWIKWTASRAAASVFVCRALQERLVALGADPGHMHVLRNGVDLEMFAQLDREACRKELGMSGRRWMLSVGHLIRRKGHDVAIEALAMMPEDTGLAIVGEGEERARLERVAARHGVASRVIFAGARPQSELPRWYNAADVLVLCSTREGWPNVLLEAMACGTPAVATAVWGVPEVICSPAAGRLVEERTPAAFAAAVLTLFSSGIDREATRAHAAAFDWHETTRGQLELFRLVCRRSVCTPSQREHLHA